ncbi:hypothetical protein BDZ91DRAFT_788297 [Kalaharituber pfeilii]|nr:hypothetical protein BDZ91DRAFT_788297 [Kalaharituber pfeilii]
MRFRAVLFISTFFTLLTVTSAHLTILRPKPIAFDELGGPDKYSAPLKADRSDFPCKQVFKVGTSEGIGPVVETWKEGEVATFTIHDKGVAAHWGGSCQASISYDYGKTFQDVQIQNPKGCSWGDVIFAWTWFTVTGFREMYMNCAHVKIHQPNQNITATQLNPEVHPPMFVGEINQCKSKEWFNLEFPLPGLKPAIAHNTPFSFSKPEGKC